MLEAVASARETELFEEGQLKLYRRVDRLFLLILHLQWAAAIVCALVVSPRAWEGSTSHVHLHLWIALILGAFVNLVPTIMVLTQPGSALTRHVVAFAQMCWSALLIHLSGGRVETHFHIFGSLAFLAFYRDWRVFITATVVVATDHFVRSFYWPQSVYGINYQIVYGSLSSASWRWMEHAAWVIFCDTFLIYSCLKGIDELQELCHRQAKLEDINANVEKIVTLRTEELKTSNEALQKTQEQLFQSQKLESMGKLASGVAHDFNNILGSILGHVSLLQEEFKRDEKISRRLGVIRKSTERGAALTSQILGFARKGNYEKAKFDLNRSIEECRDVLDRTAGKSIAIQLNLAAELWPIEGDSGQILQVLMNLAINARDAMSGGGTLTFESRNIVIDERFSKIHPPLKTGKHVHISVADTGTGIPKEIQSKIFDPFFTTKAAGKGSGLGLAMVYGIVSNHSGSVRVYSEVGKGSRFDLYFPAVSGATSTPEEKEEDSIPSGTMKGRTILLADDEESMLEMGEEILREQGATVLKASDGQQALELFSRHPEVDLVVLDVIMPIMDGLAATRAIQKLAPSTRIILCSGYAESREIVEIRKSGSVEFVQKPFVASRLVTKVLGMLHARQAA